MLALLVACWRAARRWTRPEESVDTRGGDGILTLMHLVHFLLAWTALSVCTRERDADDQLVQERLQNGMRRWFQAFYLL